MADLLLLGVDGGGTKCRARLCAPTGAVLGEAVTGPANIRLGLETSVASVLEATERCLEQAGLGAHDLPRVAACLALAGASEPSALAAAQAQKYPFGHTTITTDANAACVGAHRGRDGGVIVCGTGSIGWANLKGRHYRVGGWGLAVSDEGSGAWLGREALRRVLWANDARIEWTPLLRALFEQFRNDPHLVVRWTSEAAPRDFGALAPRIVDFANRGDPGALTLMQAGAAHIDALGARLIALSVTQLSLVGGLAIHMRRWLSDDLQAVLVPPAGDALDGALRLARFDADSIAA